MFAVDDYVVFGTNGVCKITNIGPMEISGIESDKLFYTLVPLLRPDAKNYTPVDNDRVVIRGIIDEPTATSLIAGIDNIEILSPEIEKKIDLMYKDCLHSCRCEELLKIIKTVYVRKKERSLSGKKVTSTDERYLKAAEDSLYCELALVLGRDRNELKKYIADRCMT